MGTLYPCIATNAVQEKKELEPQWEFPTLT